MRTIGLIGGMSWESTALYYRHINEAVKAQLGGLHSARILLASLDFADVDRLQRAGDWETAGALLADTARALEAGGAGCVVICANTMHKVAPAIEAAVRIPILHVADVTAAAIKATGATVVGLLGTRFTMEQDFYRDRLREQHGLTVLTPPQAQRDRLHEIIYEELCVGQVPPASRADFFAMIADLAAQGAQAVILGCTELGMLTGADDAAVPLFDTTAIHAHAAVAWALAPA